MFTGLSDSTTRPWAKCMRLAILCLEVFPGQRSPFYNFESQIRLPSAQCEKILHDITYYSICFIFHLCPNSCSVLSLLMYSQPYFGQIENADVSDIADIADFFLQLL